LFVAENAGQCRQSVQFHLCVQCHLRQGPVLIGHIESETEGGE
jgi:hypothetical protein